MAELILQIIGTISLFGLIFLAGTLTKGRIKLESKAIKYIKPFENNLTIEISNIKSIDVEQIYGVFYRGTSNYALRILITTTADTIEFVQTQKLQIGGAEFIPTKLLINQFVNHVKKHKTSVAIGPKLQEYLQTIDTAELEKHKKGQHNTVVLLAVGLIFGSILMYLILILNCAHC